MKSLTLKSLVVAFVLALPGSAAALTPPPGHTIDRIFGNTAYVQSSRAYVVRSYDLRRGGSVALDVPIDYSAENDPTVARGSQLVGVSRDTSSLDAGTVTLFRTDKHGLKTLATWQADARACHYLQEPLAIDPRGRAIVLELAASTTTSGECAIDVSRTHVLRYSSDGTAEALWLPDRFARWLKSGSAAISGDVLAVSTVQSGRIALLDQRDRTTRFISTGVDFGRFSFAGPRSLLVQKGDLATSLRRYSTAGNAGSWILRNGAGMDATATACGNYTAIATNHHLQVRDAHGRTIYRRDADGKRYGRPDLTCSGEYLHYSMLPACCDSGDSPAVRRVGGLLDLSRLGRNRN
jgi:hypothetical protein